MLNNRQNNIYNYFLQNTDTYFTGKELAKLFHVSDRTISSDLKSIKLYAKEYPFIDIHSKAGSGTILNVMDQVAFQDYVQRFMVKNPEIADVNLSDQETRARSIVKFLLDSSLPITKYNLMGLFYVSESTLYNDFKIIEQLLVKYNLTLEHTTGVGYFIEGKERDKRKSIIEENLHVHDDATIQNNKNFSHAEIKKAVIKILYEHMWSISDYQLENLLNHIVLMSHRIENNQLINYYETQDVEMNSIEYNIANEIIQDTIRNFNFNKRDLKYEALYLATNLISKSDYESDNVVSQVVTDFILTAFDKINKEFGIDFTNDKKFINTFAVHISQMLKRIEYDFQLKSNQELRFKQLFPVANNIATYFVQLLDIHFNLKAYDSEITYLTSYFNYAMNHNFNSTKNKKILLITKYRESELLTLKNMLSTWFENQVSVIETKPLNAIDNIDINKYDVILTTESNLEKYKGAVIKISLFPNDDDFNKINLALNGYNNINSILSKFDEQLFYKGKLDSKEEVLEVIFNLAEQNLNLTKEFREAILAREDYGMTFYDNNIAIPHPITPVTTKTFVIIVLLEEPISWNGDQTQIILLVNIEKNNPKAFHLWHYLTYLISDEQMVQHVLADLSYLNFMEQLRTALAPIFISN